MGLSAKTLRGKMKLLPDPMQLTITPWSAGTSPAAPFTTNQGRRRPLDWADVNFVASLQLTAPTANFLFPAEDTGGYEPVMGDTITDLTVTPNQVWNIIGPVKLELQGTIFRCLCKRQI